MCTVVYALSQALTQTTGVPGVLTGGQELDRYYTTALPTPTLLFPQLMQTEALNVV